MKDLDELDQPTREIIARGRHALDPDPATRARVYARMRLELAGPGAAVTTTRPLLAQAAKWIVATAVVGGAASGAAYWQRRTNSATTSTTTARATPQAAPLRVTAPTPAFSVSEPAPNEPAPSALERTAPLTEPSPPRAVRPATSTNAAANNATANTNTNTNTNTDAKRLGLAAEVELLAAANAALNGGDANRARKLLTEYDRTFYAPVLREERAAAEALLVCANGDAARSSAAASRFAARWPRSPLKQRIERACAGAK